MWIHTYVTTNEILRQINTHSHGSDAAEVVVNKIHTSIKRQAKSTQETPVVILNNAYENLPLSVKGKLPNYQALKKTIQRRRLQLAHYPAQPDNISDLVIPTTYSKYENKRFFLEILGKIM